MSRIPFDEFVAIDWSGAKAPYNGIAVARCAPGRAAPRLVESEAGRWTRTGIAEWLCGELASGKRLLIGFDFAFGFPYEVKLGYLGGRAPEAKDAFALWSLVDSVSTSDDDFGCDGIVTDPRFRDLFRRPRVAAAGWSARHRVTDAACAKLVGRPPETVYKLIGPAQVGKASLTGIRVLRALRAHHEGHLSIWPFEAPGKNVAVEIFPTFFRGSRAKIRTASALNAALARWGSRQIGVAAETTLSDHETDALVSAAALRVIADDPARWASVSPRARREGWIFGVAAS